MKSPTAGRVGAGPGSLGEFKHRVDFVDKSVTREDVSEARDLGPDLPLQAISVRYGKYGPFVQLAARTMKKTEIREGGRISAWTP